MAAASVGGAHASGVNAKSKTPVPRVAACTHSPVGVMASVLTAVLSRPVTNGAQNEPAVVVRKTPVPGALA
jgi:hypothetical protein